MSKPVIWIDKDGKKWLIRGIPTKLLQVLVAKAVSNGQMYGALLRMNSHETITAMAHELLRRPDARKYAQAAAVKLCSPPCACGGPGLYVVGTTTYCRNCKPHGDARMERWSRSLDRNAIIKGKALDGIQKLRRKKEAFHDARDPRKQSRMKK